MFRALARATMLMVVAPSAPVAWWPGAAPLSESLRRRLPVRAVAPVRGATTVLAGSGREVLAVPIEPDGMRAPWGEPQGIAGVVIRTSTVPVDWLRPLATATAARTTGGPLAFGPDAGTRHIPAVPARDAAPRYRVSHRSGPTAAARFRRAAALAVGVFVSLVAVEAAARAGRR